MKHHPLYLAVAMFAIILFAGNCRKSEISFESEAVSFSIAGRVLDKDNFPVAQAAVKAGSVSAVTDVNGYFTLTNVRLPKDAAYVKVEKSGFFPGSRTFVANAQTENYVNIRLIPHEVTGTFQSAGGGLVTLSEGSTINFQPNGIVDANKAAYNGTVSVSAFFIDPTQPDFISIMPGDLRGINTSNQERGLESFGMMAVELTGSGGQKLQLANGKPATINFMIPAGLRASAPATIPLWYFDEEKGLWKEEGVATKQGDKYVGTVNHFSFWNCDAPFDLVNFEAIVKDQNGDPVADALVTLKKVSDSTMGCGRTDANGKVSGKIPANEALVMKIFDRCNTLLYSQNIGPYSSNANLGVITVNRQPPATVTISGTVVNCSSGPVTNGYVNIYLDGMSHRVTLNNGNFSLDISRCNSNAAQASIVAVDVANNVQGSSVLVPVTSGAANAGQLTACGISTNEFVNVNIQGNAYQFTSPNDSLDFYHIDSLTNEYNTLVASNQSNDYFFMDYAGATTTGVFTIGQTSIGIGSNKYHNQNFQVTITYFGNVGDFVMGTLGGTVIPDQGGSPLVLSGNFKVRRTR